MNVGPLVRDLVVLLHLFALAGAFTAIVCGDAALFTGKRIDGKLLTLARRIMAPALALLWFSGLAIVGLDLWMNPERAMFSDKLLAKVSVVIVLTLNGWALHRWVFPRLVLPDSPTGSTANWAALLGAVSQVSWTYAAFIGVARAWAPLLGYRGLMAVYLLALLFGIAISWRHVRPLLRLRMAPDGVDPSAGGLTAPASRIAATSNG